MCKANNVEIRKCHRQNDFVWICAVVVAVSGDGSDVTCFRTSHSDSIECHNVDLLLCWSDSHDFCPCFISPFLFVSIGMWRIHIQAGKQNHGRHFDSGFIRSPKISIKPIRIP